MEKKTRKSNVAEVKVQTGLKMRPSIKLEAMEFIKTDPEIKSFNDLLEIATIAYIKEQKKKPREHEKQSKINID